MTGPLQRLTEIWGCKVGARLTVPSMSARLTYYTCMCVCVCVGLHQVYIRGPKHEKLPCVRGHIIIKSEDILGPRIFWRQIQDLTGFLHVSVHLDHVLS